MSVDKFQIQEQQYQFPYHYLVDFDSYNNLKYLKWGLEYYAYMKYTIDYIAGLEFQTLVDVGCGEGRLVSELARRFPDKSFTGTDLSEPPILLAKGMNYHKNNVKFFADDVGNIEGSFDIVVCNEVLEHIPEEEISNVVDNMKAKLNEGGTIVVTVPASNMPVQKKHYRHYDIDLLKQHMEGCTLVKSKYIYSKNKLFKYLIRFVTQIAFLKRLERWIGELFLFNANARTGKHIFAVFKV